MLVSGGASELEDLIHILTKNGITSVGTEVALALAAPYVTGYWRKGHQIRSKMIMVVMIMFIDVCCQLYHAINNFSNVQMRQDILGRRSSQGHQISCPKPRRQAC